MTDAEAWAVLAETVRAAGPYRGGLCDTLVRAAREGVIGLRQWRRMEHQLYEYRHIYSKGVKHFWPLGQVAPRVRACYKLAEITS